MPHHLVYEFGWNTKAAASGGNTGTTTIDVTGVAPDGGLSVTATDQWWNAVQPKQSANCEVYPNGNVACSKAPYNLTVIQASVLPLFGQNYFAALAGGSSGNWKSTYTIKASFAPSVNRGFAGQVSTWNGDFTLENKGVVPEQPPLVLIHSNGTLKQQSGRYITVTQKANFLYDPRIKTPVYVNNLMSIVPKQSTNTYSVELKLIKYQ
ncbi:MAG: hypothetical protein JO219_07635 [Candidatus Eremiobacteraeota bacterium]|nr:hypothetical protein [Candidatus Eremiobacteraeota bacterium]MBV8366515.1 hypothetical protein [Candidatus Eremiobacteraeota bacterium]